MQRGAARVLILVAPLLLAGCRTINPDEFQLPSSKNYTPIWVEMSNQTQYNADLNECHWVPDNMSPKPNAGTILASTGSGATSDGAVAVINVMTVVGGAVAGFLNGLITGFDLLGNSSIKSLVICMDKLTTRDGSAVMADPHQ